MAALLIINYDVTDTERLDACRASAVIGLVELGEGTVLAVTDSTVDLGEGNGAGATTVILGFSSAESAQRAFASDEYQAVVGERIAATNPSFAIIVPMIDG